MKYEAIKTAPTIEQAKDLALEELNAPDSADIIIDVLQSPVKKTLGLFGGAPAKVRAYYEVPDAPAQKSEPKKSAPAPKKPAAEKKKEAPASPAVKNSPKVAKETPAQKAQINKEAKKTSSPTDKDVKVAEDYLAQVIAALGIENATISAEMKDDGISIQIDCDEKDYGYIIGRRGETLDSLQYLTRLVVNREKAEYMRISINVGSYREKREKTLNALAQKNAARVKKYGRNVVLDPMNPYERRIIHTAVQQIDGVDSHSVGSDSERKVVITLAPGAKPANGGDSYRRNNNSTTHRPAASRDSGAPAQEAQRTPRSDTPSSKIYGKVEKKAD